MSYLTPPRFSFSGESYANASTATNNDIASVFDVDNIVLNKQMNLMQGGQTLPSNPPLPNVFNWMDSSNNPALRKWLMGAMEAPDLNEDPIDPGNPKSEGQAQMAHWNYYGDHNTEFRKTLVNGVQLSKGPAPQSDPAYNLHVELLGDIFYQARRGAVLVDVDPYALNTSQIFSGQFKLTYRPKPNIKIPVLMADHPTVAYSYYINPFKNVNPSCTGFEAVSAIFQFGLPIENLVFYKGGDFHSPALIELEQQAMQGRGLMVRFCLYNAIFKIQATELADDFAKGQYVFNPYEGRVLGSLGVWNDDDLASAPPGRKLKYQSRYTYVVPPAEHPPDLFAAKKKKAASLAKYRHRAAAAVPAADPTTKTATLGQTLASVDQAKQVVSLDCISTFPEKNIANRDKLDMGVMNLVLLYGAPPQPGALPPNAVTIGAIPYDKATYESGGGVVDVSYSGNAQRAVIDANLATGLLAIAPAIPPAAGSPNYLVESPYLDVQTDDRARYFDVRVKQESGTVQGTSQIQLQVTRNGLAPTAPVKLNLEYWMCQKDFINPDKWQVPVAERYFTVTEAAPLPPTNYPNVFNGGPPNATVITDQVTVPAGGRLTLHVTGVRAGVSMIRFVDPTLAPAPANNPPPLWLTSPPMPNFGWDNVDYAVIRILPFDDFSQYTDAQINNWNFLYSNVLGFYSVMYPIMSKVIPWGPDGAPNNPQEVKAFASNILAFTDPDIWNSTIYMPITRDLSGGKRELVRRWCNLQQ